MAAIEKALQAAGCKGFKNDDRTVQTIGPYEYLSTTCTLKGRETRFSLRRPAMTPEASSINPEPYSPATWNKKFPGELYDEAANVYVDILVNGDNAGEASKPLFAKVVKAP